ncbi:Hypothetical_protein [Hexamita inflata]|uniref:Hypothetical_protein n=1 Tax=Hexamita inflata TaxID=28002 RepID=A0AA86P6Q3_9EUKA|nr:Hypothetical protein HINF_LOCUS18847 [Hexamita inflata]
MEIFITKLIYNITYVKIQKKIQIIAPKYQIYVQCSTSDTKAVQYSLQPKIAFLQWFYSHNSPRFTYQNTCLILRTSKLEDKRVIVIYNMSEKIQLRSPPGLEGAGARQEGEAQGNAGSGGLRTTADN